MASFSNYSIQSFRIVPSLAICFLLLCANTSSTKVNWLKYQHQKTGVRAIFPSEYNEVVEDKSDEYRTTKVSCELEGAFYFLGITEHFIPLTDRSELQEVSLNSFTETTQGKIIRKEDWKYKKIKGIKAKIDMEFSEILYRVLIVDDVQIQLVIAYPKESTPSDKLISKFFKSFKR